MALKRGRHEDDQLREQAEEDVDASMNESSSSDDDDDEDLLTFAEQNDQEEDEEDDVMEEDQDADQTAMTGHIDVEFVFSDPKEAHFHSVKQFLLSFLPPTEPLDVSGLATLVVNQVSAGTMVCVDGEPDAYAFLTALSMQRYKDENCVRQIRQYVLRHCSDASQRAKLEQVFETKNIGLLLNHRLINLPYQLVPALHSALQQDLAWAVEHEEPADMRASFQFDAFLVLGSCTLESAPAPTQGAAKSKVKKAKTTATPAAAATARFFSNFEDEFLEAEAEIAFAFETPRSERERAAHQRETVVMLIDCQRHAAALANLGAMLNA